uniref:Uncharacterized protein n=1 Tax=Spermophilus dauricus TaxID=99837 RepID=A0A8C9Q934_SPEDA
MQWFTELMELFLSVWELIKTLNLYFVCVSEHNAWPAGHDGCLCLALHCLLLPTWLPRSGGVPTQSWITSQLSCPTGSRPEAGWGPWSWLTCGLGVGDVVLAQQTGKPLYLL